MFKTVFSDFDGTLTVNNQLLPIFFDINDLIESSGGKLVLVSGRSISWGQFLVTHFPINYCIMEGGGVIVESNGNVNLLAQEDELALLEDVSNKLLSDIPDCPMSADSFGRLTDRAIDLTMLKGKTELIEEIYNFLEKSPVSYSASNVHINFWCGEISKFAASEYFLDHFQPGVTLDDCVYFGDALNDESMFKGFKNSVGVSNIADCLDDLKYVPKIVLEGDENIGPHGVYNYLKSVLAN